MTAVPAAAVVTVRAAVDRFLSSARCTNPNTRRSYAAALNKWAGEVGPHRELGAVAEDEAADALDELWGAATPGTWNQRRAAVASFLGPDPPDETRALPQAEIERLLARRDVPLREKTLWRMLYETAARASEVLGLNVDVLDLERRRAQVRSKGGAFEYVYWSTGTARLLPRLINGRTRGPLFLSERRPVPARMPRAEDLCPETGRARLGYDRARVLLDHYTSPGDGQPGWDLHQLRHSAATTLGEKGTALQLIMAKTRHRNPRTAMRYVKPGGEAVAEVTNLLDTAPPRR